MASRVAETVKNRSPQNAVGLYKLIPKILVRSRKQREHINRLAVGMNLRNPFLSIRIIGSARSLHLEQIILG